MRYRRANVQGGTYFFTVNLADRTSTLLTDHIETLRSVLRRVKRDHDFEIDVPGKDSHRLRVAGARQVLLASPYRTFWVEEGNGSDEPRLADLLAHLRADTIDLVLVEGFRFEHLPKITSVRAVRFG